MGEVVRCVLLAVGWSLMFVAIGGLLVYVGGY